MAEGPQKPSAMFDVRVKWCAYELFKHSTGIVADRPGGRATYLPGDVERFIRRCWSYPELVIMSRLMEFDCHSELVVFKLLNRGKVGVLVEMLRREPGALKMFRGLGKLLELVSLKSRNKAQEEGRDHVLSGERRGMEMKKVGT